MSDNIIKAVRIKGVDNRHYALIAFGYEYGSPEYAMAYDDSDAARLINEYMDKILISLYGSANEQDVSNNTWLETDAIIEEEKLYQLAKSLLVLLKDKEATE